MTAVAFSCDNAPIPADWRAKQWDWMHDITTRGREPTNNFHIEDIETAFVGAIDGRAYDLVRIAAYAFAADMEVRRGGDADWKLAKWKRTLALSVGVNEPEFWSQPDVHAALTACLGFLSDDHWQFAFSPAANDLDRQVVLPETPASRGADISAVIAFSGGMDSLAAAVAELHAGRVPVLVSLEASNIAAGHRGKLISTLRKRYPSQPFGELGARVHRTAGEARERTRRTRSFVVASLAAAAANGLGGVDVILADNGFVSLNLPINDQLIGARATRSTHPRFLRQFRELLAHVFDRPPKVSNPLWNTTRQEVVRALAETVGPETVVDTRSCAGNSRQHAGRTHCGVCSQCIDRRFAIHAAGIDEFEPSALYGMDIFRDDLSGDARTMAVGYVRQAQRIAGLSDEDLVLEYPQILDAVSPESHLRELRAYIDLLRRQAKGVLGVMRAVAESQAVTMAGGTLSPDSLVYLASVPPPALRARLADDGMTYSPDYRAIDFNGIPIACSAGQAKVIANLHAAFTANLPGLSLDEATAGSDLNSTKMLDVLRRSGAWRTLVVSVPGKRLYRLALER